MQNGKENILEQFTSDQIAWFQKNQHMITEDLLISLRKFGNKGKQIALEILDMRKNIEGYYTDCFNKRISFNGNRSIKKAFTKLKVSPIHKIEIEKCAKDIQYFKDNYVKIGTKRGINFPDLRKYQNDFFDIITDDESDSIVGLLPRQSGKTITVCMYLAHSFLFKESMNIGVCANKLDLAKEFLNNTKNIITNLPIWLQVGMTVWNVSDIGGENGMRILTAAPSEGSFRGYTISILIMDEVAFIPEKNWAAFSDSVFPSQSALAFKKNVLISTAKGMNHFYDIVRGARENTNGFKIFEMNWRDVPRFNKEGKTIDPEEYKESIIKKEGILHWNQNYENIFLGSSDTLITTEYLERIEPIQYQEKRDGKLKIFKYPEPERQYIMAVDPAKDGRDAFAVQILDVTDMNFEQVAVAKLQIDYLRMPDFLDEWGKLYNYAYIIVENNEGAGQSIADQLKKDYYYINIYYDYSSSQKNLIKARKKYPGFRCTARSRRLILQTLKLFIENDKLKINDRETLSELLRFVFKDNKYQGDDYPDDLVMSLATAFAPFCSLKNFSDMKTLVKTLYNDAPDNTDKRFSDFVTGAYFDDGSDYEETSDADYTFYENYDSFEYNTPDNFHDYDDIDEFGNT